MSEIAMYCCTSTNCRRKFREASELCDFDDVPDPKYARLSIDVALPRLESKGITGLTSEADRKRIQAVLGDPQASGGGIDARAASPRFSHAISPALRSSIVRPDHA